MLFYGKVYEGFDNGNYVYLKKDVTAKKTKLDFMPGKNFNTTPTFYTDSGLFVCVYG